MKVCLQCGSEYQDAVSTCVDCKGQSPLVDGARLAAQSTSEGGRTATDARRFVRAGTAEDPLTAERFGALLTQAGIAVMVHSHPGGSVDAITSGFHTPWWDIRVPESDLRRAATLLTDERSRIEAGADEAGRAAEEEELEQERETSGRAPAS